MRSWVVAALLVGAALTLTGCGGTVPAGGDPPTATAPLTFSIPSTVPTSTVATPTSHPYLGPDGFPIETGQFLAPSTTTHLGAIIHGVQCEPLAQLAYAAYAHLQVYVHGKSRALPGGIGMVDQNPVATQKGLYYSTHLCMYWLHTRAADGLIEAEAPIPRHFTLGDLFAVWNQPLSSRQVARARGRVTATLNGVRWSGDPAAIPLTEHAAIQLSVGRPVRSPQPVDWVGTNF